MPAQVEVIEEVEQPVIAEKGSLAIIERAVALKLGADELQKLVALHERLEDRRAEAAYAQAMNACQRDLSTLVVVRDKANAKTQKKYASLDAIGPIVRAAYTRHGFAISFSEESAEQPGCVRTVAEVMHEGGCTKRKWLELPRDGVGPKGEPIGGMNAVQGCISSGSYAQRVLLTRIFDLTIADSDRDGNSDNETLTDEQVAELDQLMEAIRDAGKPWKFEKFMGWLSQMAGAELERVGDLPARHFAVARDALKATLRKGGAA